MLAVRGLAHKWKRTFGDKERSPTKGKGYGAGSLDSLFKGGEGARGEKCDERPFVETTRAREGTGHLLDAGSYSNSSRLGESQFGEYESAPKESSQTTSDEFSR